MMNNRRFLSITMAAFFVVSVLGSSGICVSAQDLTEEKPYLILMETEKACEEVSELVGTDAETEVFELSDSNMIVEELTECEVKELETKKDVLIEEDIVIFANAALTEPKQKKIERYEKIKKAREEQREKEPEYEWNLKAVHAEDAAAEQNTKQQQVKVAVLDSGVDYVSGINLAGQINLVEEEQYLPEMFQDMTGHGTGIAGVIAGNGETGIYGINPNAWVYSVRVLDSENKAPLSRIVKGIYWCIENDINIINMSFGTSVYSKVLEQAVADAYAANILMVGASGNTGGDVEYPAAFDGVVAVAATDTQARISDFSNIGEELDVAAPGEKIRTASFFDGSVVTHGTSIAAPHVTGTASLLWEKDLTKTNEFIRQLICESTMEIAGTEQCGLLDASYAMQIYDSFAENFNDNEMVLEEPVPDNEKEPESFAYVDGDEAYVEGRWGGTDHQQTITGGNTSMGTGFTDDQMKRLKNGVVHPDNHWKGPGVHSPWHGAWHYRADGGYRVNVKINYAAAIEVMTSIALEGGNTSSFKNYKDFSGIDQITFNDLKATIDKFYNSHQDLTKEQRKFFLYGCGIHAITDLFAHSTTEANGDAIVGSDKDDTEYLPRRYRVAARAAAWAMESLSEGVATDGAEIIFALDDVFTAGTKFRVINVKKYVNDNGYEDDILNLANVSK